jgi:ribA/ribD-fused uncharacterized protein
MIDNFTGPNAFLSNFYPCIFNWDGTTWVTSEHAYQAAKMVLPNDRLQIQRAVTPGQAKKLGRWLRKRDNFDSIKSKIMLEIVEAKFSQNPDLMARLLATGTHELVEGNTWGDTYWGVCGGVGSNNLGLVLMDIRAKYSPL